MYSLARLSYFVLLAVFWVITAQARDLNVCDETTKLIHEITGNFAAKKELVADSKWLKSTIDEACLKDCSVEQLRAFKGMTDPVGPSTTPVRRTPIGEEEKPKFPDSKEEAASIRMQIQAEKALAKRSFQVWRRPRGNEDPEVAAAYTKLAELDQIKRSRDPDILLGPELSQAKIFDIISLPRGEARHFWNGIFKKVDPDYRQTRRLVINLFENENFKDNPAAIASLRQIIIDKANEALKEKKAPLIDQVIAIVQKNGGQTELVYVFP